jgi:hypothetical protein
MTGYRLYFSSRNGANATEFECRDDQEAMEVAEKLAIGQNVELWQGTRHVSTLKESAAPPSRPARTHSDQ